MNLLPVSSVYPILSSIAASLFRSFDISKPLEQSNFNASLRPSLSVQKNIFPWPPVANYALISLYPNYARPVPNNFFNILLSYTTPAFYHLSATSSGAPISSIFYYFSATSFFNLVIVFSYSVIVFPFSVTDSPNSVTSFPNLTILSLLFFLLDFSFLAASLAFSVFFF